jgi:hypothetical protein
MNWYVFHPKGFEAPDGAVLNNAAFRGATLRAGGHEGKAPKILALISILAFATSSGLAAQATMTGQEVMDRAAASPKLKGGSVLTMTMVITKNKQSLTRMLTTWTTGDGAKGEVEKTLMKFLAPADVKGSGFLNLKKPDGSTESLLWLPALGKVRRLGSGSSDQDQAFFGSDFTNRDINGFAQADFTYATNSLEGGIYTVTATPKKPLGYDKLVYQIDSGLWKQVRIDYWRGGKLVKSQAIAYGKVQGYDMPSKIIMSSASGSATELRFTDYKLDQDLGDQFFTERFLKQ